MKIPKIDERQKKGVGEGTTIFRGGGGGGGGGGRQIASLAPHLKKYHVWWA